MNSKFDDAGAAFRFAHPIDAALPSGPDFPVCRPDPVFIASKRIFDLLSAVLALPVLALAALALCILNPIWNPGPLIYRQLRMGRDCRPFTAYKFRTMRCGGPITRGPHDPVERDRITRLGRLLRRSRIDELPQFLNVMRGDMSLIGPRPDFWDHAVHYLDTVPGYRERCAVTPGISGLAQVESGYAEGIEATFLKVALDLCYIRGRGWRMELYVLWRTIVVMTTGRGAR